MDATTRRRWLSIIINRCIELVIVFVGVYAAFMLNAHQTHQQEQQRRAQLIAYLEKQVVTASASLKNVAAICDRKTNEFVAQLAKGDMPRIAPISISSSYNPNENAWLLQSGGLELLDIQTIARLKELDTVAATGMATMTHYQQLSDALIVPHLGDGSATFYDPATRQLRPLYALYPEILKDIAQIMNDLREKTDHLLEQLRAEQAKRR